ncbi:LysR family transcriptional regulator [Aureimonas mangrovi]|uniref:LysR family transcriptional regulator n=1 Tax=Aureimonas mangrovi TaxID=2758041 RepID=UPI00163D99CF|nr:LysR family transcriptional regulator [Aureimonas mangrovi]
MRYDLPDLRLFLAVVDAGSITHGASAMNLSLGAASERLREMEISGGAPLLERHRRGARPTRAGDALAHHARLILRQVGAMQAELAEHMRGFRGSVRLLANSAAMTQVLPERLGCFLAAHPTIDIDLGERESTEIVKAVAGDLAEIGIVADTVATGELETLPFADDALVVVMARDHVLAGTRRLSFAQIAGEPQIGFDGALQRHLAEHAARAGLRLRPRLVLRSFEAVCRAASTGAGVGIVPKAAARHAARTARLAAVPLTDPWAQRRLMICVKDPATLAPTARLLFDHLSTQSAHERSGARLASPL